MSSRQRAGVVAVAVALTALASRGDAKLLRVFDDPNTSGGDGLASAVQSVLLLNGKVVAGAPLTSFGGIDAAGVVHVFDAGGRLLTTIRSPNPATNGLFGTVLAAAGTDLLVAAPGDSANGTAGVGEVYRFDGTTFAPLATYRPPQLQSGVDFGVALAVDGGTVYVAGTNSIFSSTTGAGVVHALDLATGNTLHSFPPPVDIQDGAFGQAMVVSGNSLVVGAPGTTASGVTGAGTVYFLDTNAAGTVVRRSVQSTNPTANGAYGAALAVAGSALLVGAPGNSDLGGPPSGLVYVLDPATGVTRRSFGRLGTDAGSDFGRAIVVGSASISVAAPGASADGRSGAGQIYQFDLAGTVTQRILSSLNTAVDAHFGTTFAAAGTQLVVGEPMSVGGTPKLYLFDSGSSGSPGGGQGGGTTTTSTTTTLPGDCAVAPSLTSADCQLDALTATVTADALGPLTDRLLGALARVRARVQAAETATTPGRTRKELRAALSTLRVFERRLRGADGRVAFEKSSVLGLLTSRVREALLDVLVSS